MRGLAWVAGALVLLGCGIAACASGDDPGTSFNDDTGPGVGGSGGGNGGASGDGGDDGPNGPSGPSPSSVTSVTSTSGPTGGSTSTSTATTSGDPASSSSTGTPPCNDQGPGEPNDTVDMAHDLGEIGSPDGDGGQVTGNLREPDDVDWYKYTGSDDFDGAVDPTRSVVGAGMRVCMFAACIDGDTVFDCPSDTVPTTEGTLAGCCWNGNQEVALGGFNCDGPISDDAVVYMKVEHPDGPGCESYTINYHY